MEIFDLDPNAPWNNEEENECECGKPCNEEFCSEECYLNNVNS